jgi:hypothetical protein
MVSFGGQRRGVRGVDADHHRNAEGVELLTHPAVASAEIDPADPRRACRRREADRADD